jgi:glycosyltransferase involved in cell wall biosynthesis
MNVRGSGPRVLMFAPFSFPPIGPESLVTAKLLLAMHDAGWDVDVIAQASGSHLYPLEDTSAWGVLSPHVRSVGPRIGFGILARRSSIWRAVMLVSSIMWATRAYWAAISSRRRYDLILSRSSPIHGHLPALMFANRTGIPWIANWNDPGPQVKMPPPYGLGQGACLPRIYRCCLDAVVRTASWHTFPCERLRAYMTGYLARGPLPNSSVVPHIALGRFREVLEVDGQRPFSLCHIGELKAPRNPDVFFIGLSRFLNSCPERPAVRVDIVGRLEASLLRKAAQYGVASILHVTPPVSYVKALALMSQSHVLVIIEAACKEGVFLPSKFVDYVQTGRPILALSPRVGTLADIVSASGGGIAVDCESPEAVAGAIGVLYEHWKAGTLDKAFSSARLSQRFGEEHVVGAYREIFERVRKRRFGEMIGEKDKERSTESSL